MQSDSSASPDRATSSQDRIDTALDMRPERRTLDVLPADTRHDRLRLRNASWAFTTRRVPPGSACTILPLDGSPCVGDVVLARIDAIGNHANLQLVNGRRRHLFPGDEIVVAYGNRYASNQFESYVPETLGPCHLVAGGGIASRAASWHAAMSRGPTHITPIGLAGDNAGRRLNLSQFSLPEISSRPEFTPTTIAVIGTAMDSGKTQTCVHLVRGLISAGLRVGYAKITGTGAGGDFYWLKDAGAGPVLDFTDLGMPSTYLVSIDVIESALAELVDHLASGGVDAAVVEIADGVLQQETAALLQSKTFRRRVGGVVLAAQDAMGAAAGTSWLREREIEVLALAGVLTASPLQTKEASEVTGLPLFDREGLATPQNAVSILGRAQQNSGGVGSVEVA